MKGDGRVQQGCTWAIDLDPTSQALLYAKTNSSRTNRQDRFHPEPPGMGVPTKPSIFIPDTIDVLPNKPSQVHNSRS